MPRPLKIICSWTIINIIISCFVGGKCRSSLSSDIIHAPSSFVLQAVEDVADAIGLLKHLQERHYEDDEKASEPLDVPAEIVTLAEFRKRRTSDRPSGGDS